MAKFKGTCIGGVADGHWIERDDPHMTVSVTKRLRSNVPSDGNDREEVIEKTRYKYLLLLGTANQEIGCWAPEGVVIEQVIARLVKHYNPNAGMVGQPAPNKLPIGRQEP